MWNDNETDADFIDYQHLVNAIKEIIDTDNLLPCSIGIFGDWGSGKSSLMKMVQAGYLGDEDTLIIRFNGWLFEGYEDAKTVLMSKIVDEIIAKRKLAPKAIKVAARLLKRIDVIKAGGSLIKHGLALATLGPAGLAVSSGTELIGKLKETDYEKYISERNAATGSDEDLKSNIQDFHENFSELIRETDLKKVIIFIDDLDRCSHDTIIGTLEAIKLFLFTKHTAFVIGADERLIKHAVKRRFPEIPGENAEVGRDYLEKLIQFPIRIPPLNTMELTTYINLLFAELHIDVGEFGIIRDQIIGDKRQQVFDFTYDIKNADEYSDVSDSLKEDLLLCSQVVPVLSTGLNGNPRQCKRFLNTLLLRIKMATSKQIDLKRRVLAKLMLLEYFKSETFKSFYELQALNGGKVKLLADLEKAALGKVGGYKGDVISSALLEDKWIASWLCMEPLLSDVDLAPYYYFSRDALLATVDNIQRMSAVAQEHLTKLFSGSKAAKSKELEKVSNLHAGDAAAMLEHIMTKVREEEDHSGDFSALTILFEFCQKRQETYSQLLAFLEKMPETNLPIKAATYLSSTFKGTSFSAGGKKLMEKWSISTSNSRLAKVASTKLSDF